MFRDVLRKIMEAEWEKTLADNQCEEVISPTHENYKSMPYDTTSIVSSLQLGIMSS